MKATSRPNDLPKYIFQDKLGAGSFSTVYKAVSRDSQQNVVAIKCIEKSKLSKSGEDNIVSEIKLMKSLHHEHVLRLLDFTWDRQFVYLILQYCDQGSLAGFIKKRRQLPEAVCRKFLQQLACGLGFLHSKNVCHFDLKPSNLLLVRQPWLCLKIADFGLAQLLSEESRCGSLRGSPMYMAPEMLLKRPFTSKVDLWSVGVIAFECLFGKPPLPSGSCQELVHAISSQLPIHIPADSVSSHCLDLLARLLVYEPDARISFQDFFDHPFLELEFYPSPESYKAAVRLAKEAVLQDSARNYSQAFSLYCKALKFLTPHLERTEGEKRLLLSHKLREYLGRAEAIKAYTEGVDRTHHHHHHPSSTSSNSQSLSSLSASTPQLGTAMEIGESGLQYLAEGNYSLALDKLQASLRLLGPLLDHEPPGLRRDLLLRQVAEIQARTDTAKSLLEAQVAACPPNTSSLDLCLVQ